ncbi:ABC transporter transmembrane domain-containing protein [Secundilactobacillus collinoides]|uniref:ABC transporter transmembrane domain-containing protein n=1 Tax=Secundilactobacillus collinoides TaxID=33960 RepID=UPI0006D206DB|nr:ABC transporter transmembrane domain-containing protein [Secundilactobacillus collinoides]
MGYYAIATGFQTTPWLLLFLAALVGGFCRFGEQYLGHLVAFKLLSRFRNKVYDKLMVLAPAKLDNKHSSDLLKLVAQDISQIEIFYAHTLSPVVIAAVVSVIQVIVLAFVSPWLALIALIAYAVMGIWMPLHHAKRMKTPTAALSKADTLHQRLAAETVAGKFELQQYQASDPQLAKLNAATSDYWLVSRDKSSKQDRQALVMQLVLVISLAVFGIVAVSQNVSLMWVLLFPFSFSRVLALAPCPVPYLADCWLPRNFSHYLMRNDRGQPREWCHAHRTHQRQPESGRICLPAAP